jgi:hypothetical protein
MGRVQIAVVSPTAIVRRKVANQVRIACKDISFFSISRNVIVSKNPITRDRAFR